MTGTGGCKQAKYNVMDFLILDIFGKDNAVEGLDGDDLFQVDETVDQLQAQLHASVLPTIFCQR